MVKEDSSILREVAGNLIEMPLKPELSIIRDAMNKGNLDSTDTGNYLGNTCRYLLGVTVYVIGKTLATGTLPEETSLLYNIAVVGGTLKGYILTFGYDAIKNRLSRRKKKEFSIEENQIEIDELERRLTQMDNKTAIFQFSHRQTSEAMNTAYFKHRERLPQVKKTNF